MKAKNRQEHSTCFNHGGEGSPIIEVKKTEQGKTETFFFQKNKILFVLEGALSVSYKDFPVKQVKKKEFVFIPSGGEFRYLATEESRLIIVSFPMGAFICEGYTVKQLYMYGKESHYESIGINPLKATKLIWLFLSGLDHSLKSEVSCHYYFNLKVKELLILMRYDYSRKDLRDFFSLTLSPDTKFSEYVRENYDKYKNVSELATSLNMTLKGFSKKFTETFGETPLKWMLREKARLIYKELCTGDKPIIQIADEYGFVSQPHLNTFCKREFSKSPGEIRRRKKV